MTDTTTERRRHERTEISLSARLERIRGRELSGPAATIDLSERGARLTGPARFTVGDVVRVVLTSGDVSVEHQGLVVGRVPVDEDTATLNIAFKVSDERGTSSLRRILEHG